MRTRVSVVKLFACMLTAAALVFIAAVFDAAATTQTALDLGRAAQLLPRGSGRAEVLDRATQVLETSWSRALSWHAGALEALSWIEALRADNDASDRAALARSRAAAERSLQRAPVQPLVWVRLAALAQAGEPTQLCDARTCVERSYASGPMIDPAPACDRLQIARRAGLDSERMNAAIEAYLAARPAAPDAAACLWFLNPDERFDALLQLELLASSARAQRYRANAP